MSRLAAGPVTIAGVLAAELADQGIERIFGLAGEDTIGFITEIGARGVVYCGARHENIAVGMADGYSWRSGKIGICTVTRGPGLLNAATAIRTAVRGGRRILVITGDMPADGDWEWDFKSIEHAPLAKALGAEHHVVSGPDDVIPALHRALSAAESGLTAILSVPVDLMGAPAGNLVAPPPVTPRRPRRQTSAPDPAPAAIHEAAELLAASERPLILAGRGAGDPEVRGLLEELAARFGALLGTTLMAREMFRGSRCDLGTVGGFCSDAAIPILGQVDCVLAVGASLNRWTTAGGTLFSGVPVVQIDTERGQLGRNFPIQVGICADAAAAARALLVATVECGSGAKPLHHPEVLARLTGPLWDGPDESVIDEMDPRAVTTTLDELLPEDRTIVLDSGRHMTAAGRFMRFLGAERFRHTADGGAIGMGLGVALGAAVARPEVPTVLFVGDGAMSMTLGDLETAVRHQLPLIVVVMNDRAYGSELVHLRAEGLPWDYAELPTVDFAAAAGQLGLQGATVTSVAQLRSHADAIGRRDAPMLLDCRIRRDLFVPRVTW